MRLVLNILGVIVVLGGLYLFSENKKKVAFTKIDVLHIRKIRLQYFVSCSWQNHNI